MRNIVRCFALAGAAGLAMLCGCTNDEENSSTTTQVDPPSVYMNDPAYTAAKEKVMHARASIVSARETIVAEMEKRWTAAKAQLPEGADAAAIEASLANDPEWISLRKRLDDAQRAHADNLAEAHRIIGERIARPQTISK